MGVDGGVGDGVEVFGHGYGDLQGQGVRENVAKGNGKITGEDAFGDADESSGGASEGNEGGDSGDLGGEVGCRGGVQAGAEELDFTAGEGGGGTERGEGRHAGF